MTMMELQYNTSVDHHQHISDMTGSALRIQFAIFVKNNLELTELEKGHTS